MLQDEYSYLVYPFLHKKTAKRQAGSLAILWQSYNLYALAGIGMSDNVQFVVVSYVIHDPPILLSVIDRLQSFRNWPLIPAAFLSLLTTPTKEDLLQIGKKYQSKAVFGLSRLNKIHIHPEIKSSFEYYINLPFIEI